MTSMTPAQYAEYVSINSATRFMVTADDHHDLIKSWSRASDPRTVANAMADLYGTDLRAGLARANAPTLVLGTWSGLHEQLKQYGMNLSREDVVATFETQFEEVKRLRFVLSETARHFIMFDDPQWFFEQLDAFLTDPAASVVERGFSAR
jgi:pimeloyl-ACP methyl ester carboxylesterase